MIYLKSSGKDMRRQLMPKKTIDLFGYPRSRYEPELTTLATKRIKDGKEMLKKYTAQRKDMQKMSYEDRQELIRKYSETEAAVKWWRKILEEEQMGKIGKLFKRANEIAEGYQEARDKEFDDQLKAFIAADTETVITEDDLQGFIDSFGEDYPLEANWSWDEANAELDEIGDQQMELARDREMGLQISRIHYFFPFSSDVSRSL